MAAKLGKGNELLVQETDVLAKSLILDENLGTGSYYIIIEDVNDVIALEKFVVN